MKKIIFALAIFCSPHFLSAQDWGASVYTGNYFPIKAVTKLSPVTDFNLEATWWNPDKGFPKIGLVGFGLHYDIPGKLETVGFTNSTGVHSADISRHSWGYSTRFAWEIVQPIQHLSVYIGVGSTIFRSKMEMKPNSPLMPGDYVTDAYGDTWNYGDNSSNSIENARYTASLNIFSGAEYEFPKFNLFGQLSYNFTGDQGGIPFPKAVGLNLGIFVPLLRK